MNQKVIICRGLPASGKTTWSKEYVRKHQEFKRINRDDLRMMIYNNQWTKKREEAILLARKVLIQNFLVAGYSLVLDDTNLVPFRLEETKNIIKEAQAMMSANIDVEIKNFTNVPLEVCIERNNRRPEITRVPENFIRDYYNKYIK